MLENLKRRFFLYCSVILVLVALLATQLASLTLIKGQALSAEIEDKSTTTQILRGNRGAIYAKHGEMLARNDPSYNVLFRRDDDSKKNESWRAFYTEIMIKTIEIVERNQGKTIDTFAIKYDPVKHTYAFDWGNFGEDISDDRKSELSKTREDNWRKNMFVSQNVYNEDGSLKKKGDSPETIYHTLRKRFYIPEDMDYQQARKLLSIWQEVQLSSGTVDPVTVAYNVSEKVVAEIADRSKELDSISTIQSTQRVYPKGDLVGHIIGYVSRINNTTMSVDSLAASGFNKTQLTAIAEEQALARRQKAAQDGTPLDAEAESSRAKDVNLIADLGYATNDLIGSNGIEKTQEAFLTGSTKEHHGKKQMEISQSRIITRTFDTATTPATDGLDVYLTLDLALQQVTTDALKKNVEEIRALEEKLLIDNYENYARVKPTKDIKMADSGVAVVIDVENGNLLASAQYPSYDDNLFIGGISEANWKQLQEDTRLPLINHAIATAKAPGSIFKMAVGLAGLEEGLIRIDERINDDSPYRAFDKNGVPRIKQGAPYCWEHNKEKHAQQNIVDALQNSCNYYFFTVADRLEIEKLNEWAGEKFGMAEKTNIELPGERTGQIGGQKVHFDYLHPTRGIGGLVQKNRIIPYLNQICKELGYDIDDEKINECSIHLLQLVKDEYSTDEYLGPAIRETLKNDLKVPEFKVRTWSTKIAAELAQLGWNIGYTVRTGMGQAEVLVTPVAIARYVAALVNGGRLYDVHVVDRIVDKEGNVVKKTEPVIAEELHADPANLAAIKEGMTKVFSGEDGTASNAFKDFDYVEYIGGKTGTAQINASNNVDIENTAWIVAFAPKENPEIAIAVMIPYGKSGANCASTVKDIVQFYMDRKNGDSQTATPRFNDPVQ